MKDNIKSKVTNPSKNFKKINKNKNGKKFKEESKDFVFRNNVKINKLTSNYYSISRQLKQNRIGKPKNCISKDKSNEFDKSADVFISNKLILNKITDSFSISNSKKIGRDLPSNINPQNLKSETIRNSKKKESKKHNTVRSTNFAIKRNLNKSLIIQMHNKNSTLLKSDISKIINKNNISNKNIVKKYFNNNKSFNLKKNNTINKLAPKYLNFTSDDIIYENPDVTDFKVDDSKINNNLKKNKISKHLTNMYPLRVNKIHIKNNLTDNSKIIQKSARAVSKKPTEKEKENKLKKLNRRNFGEVQKYTKKTAAFFTKKNKLKNDNLVNEIRDILKPQKQKIIHVKTNADLFNNNAKIINRNTINRNYTNLYDNCQNNKINEKRIKKKNNLITRTITYQNFYNPKIKENTIKVNNLIKNQHKKPKNHINKNLISNRTKNNLIKKNNIIQESRRSFILSKSRGRNDLINNKERNIKSKKNNLRKLNKSIDVIQQIKKKLDNDNNDIYELIRSKSTEKKTDERDLNITKVNDTINDEENIYTILYCEEKNLDENKIDKFDEVNSIVRFIEFGLVPISQISIFSVENSKYKDYLQKFEKIFKKDVLEKKMENKKENNFGKNKENILFSDKTERTKDNSAQKINININARYIGNK